MEENQRTELIDALRKNGLKEGEYRLVFTKEFKIEPIKPELSLKLVMPYPVKLPDYHIDYFVDDEKIEAIRNYLQALLAKHGSNATLFLKMATETPDTIMNNKEIIMQLERLAKENTHLANVFMHLHTWYSPSEFYKILFIYGVAQTLEQTILHYNRLSSEYKAEARFHGEDVITTHEENAEIDYWNLRSLLHGLENKVNMLAELVRKSEAFEEFGALRRRESEVLRQREQKANISLQVQPQK